MMCDVQVADAAFEKAGVSERTQVWVQVSVSGS
jgi:hypothetical protein